MSFQGKGKNKSVYTKHTFMADDGSRSSITLTGEQALELANELAARAESGNAVVLDAYFNVRKNKTDGKEFISTTFITREYVAKNGGGGAAQQPARFAPKPGAQSTSGKVEGLRATLNRPKINTGN